ncbi:hypothetical protein [Sphingopyxis witflariensis]|uniref:hypothetical protein n=1 Tax=Sphingopyxis witflariensis TaxID=173675 RepID=UPI0011818B17|nr:hypothetical protein [Sphingopyxis witflariensis]
MSVEMSFATLETTLAVHFGIPPDDYGKFRARIKQLQRLGFPPGVNVGRGTKFAYTVDHFLQSGIALELLNSGLTGKLVTDLVTEHWQKIGAGIWAAHDRSPRNPWSEHRGPDVHLDIEVQGLKNSDGKFARIQVEDDYSRLEPIFSVGRQRCVVSVNLTAFSNDILENLFKVGQFSEYSVQNAIKKYGKIIPELKSPSFLNKGFEWYRVGLFDSGGNDLSHG